MNSVTVSNQTTKNQREDSASQRNIRICLDNWFNRHYPALAAHFSKLKPNERLTSRDEPMDILNDSIIRIYSMDFKTEDEALGYCNKFFKIKQ